MRQILKIFSRTFDSGYETVYYGLVWNWQTMKPDEVTLGYYPTIKESVDTSTPDYTQYKIYEHNQTQEILRKMSQYDTTIPGKCIPGDIVKVSAGRIVPQGTIATVVKIYDTGYGMKCILRDDKNEYKTYVKNLEVIAVDLSRKPNNFQSFKEHKVTELERAVYENL